MNHGGVETIAHEFLGQPLGAAFGAREDERLSFFLVKQLPEDIQFFSRTNFVGFQIARFRRVSAPTRARPVPDSRM